MNQHAGGNWLIYVTKYHSDIQMKARNTTVKLCLTFVYGVTRVALDIGGREISLMRFHNFLRQEFV